AIHEAVVSSAEYRIRNPVLPGGIRCPDRKSCLVDGKRLGDFRSRIVVGVAALAGSDRCCPGADNGHGRAADNGDGSIAARVTYWQTAVCCGAEDKGRITVDFCRQRCEGDSLVLLDIVG